MSPNFFSTLANQLSFGDRLRIWAEQRFGSLGDCAKAIGVDQSQLSKYMKGTREPSLEVLERMQSAGVNVSWLITGRGEMDAQSADDDLLRPPSERLAAVHEHIRRYLEEAERLSSEISSGDKRSGKSKRR